MHRIATTLFLALATGTCLMALPTPRAFIANTGQWPAQVLYAAHTADGFVWITNTGMVIDQRGRTADGRVISAPVALSVNGSTGSTHSSVRRDASTPTVSVLRPGAATTTPTASSVVVHDVRPGIDLEYVWDGDRVRYNVLVDANTPLPNPLFNVKGAGTIQIKNGSIDCTTPLGMVSMSGIVAYQPGTPVSVGVTPTLTTSAVGFSTTNVDAARPLIIDPVVYAYALHGSADEEITSIRMNKDGNVVVGGWTTSADLVTPSGTFDAGTDGFVAIMSPDLKTVLSWAYIGGDSIDAVRAIAVTSNGQVWATGETNSPGLPFPSSSISGSHSGNTDGFVVRMSANLATIMTGMYLAGNGVDLPLGIAVSKENDVAVCGQTSSTQGMPLAQGYSSQPIGQRDGFMLGMNAAGTIINTFTYFGSIGNDAFTSATFDANGNIIVGGMTSSNEYKTWPEKSLVWVPPDDEKGREGYYEEVGNNPYDVEFNGGSTDAVVTKFGPDGTLIFSTYFGGNGDDVAYAVVTDAESDVYAVGSTRSSDLPIADGSALSYGGQSDAFFAIISKDGLRLRTCGYYGGTGDEEGFGAAIDASKNLYITGPTTSMDITNVGAGSSSTPIGGKDGFLAKMSTTTVLFSSVIGWTGDDVPMCLALDARNDVYMAGSTTSTLSSTSRKTRDVNVQAESRDAFAAKFAFGTVTVRTPIAGSVLCFGKQVNLAWITEELSASETYSVDVSGDGGATWTQIAADLRTKSTSWSVPQSAPPSGSYQFRVRTQHGHATLSPVYAAGTPPLITTQPASNAVCTGAALELRAEAAGEGLTYQWYKNGAAISGATQAVYSVAAASASDAGTYHVVIGNDCASSPSADAVIAVTDTPVITQQPTGATLNVGATLTLSVTAQGSNLTYQWQFNGTTIPAPVGTQATLTIENVTAANQGTYACVIGSDCGSATTESAVVSIVTSVDDEGGEHAAMMIVAPHPASDVLNISLAHGSTISSISLTDVNGNVVASVSVEDLSSTSLSLSAIANGVYTLTAQTSTGRLARTIIVQK